MVIYKQEQTNSLKKNTDIIKQSLTEESMRKPKRLTTEIVYLYSNIY